MIVGKLRLAVLRATVAAASGCVIGAAASAQEDVIAACQALPTETERFSCLADALRQASGSAAPAQAPVAPAAEQPEPPRIESEQSRVLTASPEEFAAEQVEERPSRDETTLVASVVSSELVGFNRLQVELDNGQIWRQGQAEKAWDMILDGEPSTVEIRPSRFGGYRMTVDDGRTMSVERVR